MLLVKKLWGASQKTFGLANANYSLREGQAVKLSYFAP